LKIHTTRSLRATKIQKGSSPLQMLTCYDFQTAQLLNETEIDLLLVGDSLGNVILGYETTVEVSLEEMIVFSSAVKRGAKNKFVVADLPFGTYSTFESGIENATKLFQRSKAEAIKLEGASEHQLKLIKRLTETGVPIMGHIGLTPQSVHELGGYYVHGKDEKSQEKLLQEAIALEKAGAFCVVLECVKEELSKKISESLSIPTIGIGSGDFTDGQVLVTNDLLHMGKQDPPKFCQPVANFYELKKTAIEKYIEKNKNVNPYNDGKTLNH
jgi:3-methyl-2-oxobutanoate hydroxymethyltransferase